MDLTGAPDELGLESNFQDLLKKEDIFHFSRSTAEDTGSIKLDSLPGNRFQGLSFPPGPVAVNPTKTDLRAPKFQQLAPFFLLF